MIITDNEYEVQHARPTFQAAPTSYRVDLTKKTCSCHRFESQGFPCYHAINAIFARHENVQDYAENLFTIAEYTATYASPIYPLIPISNETPEFEDSELGLRWLAGQAGSVESEEEDQSVNELLPPDVTRRAGRPRKRRIRGHSEVSGTVVKIVPNLGTMRGLVPTLPCVRDPLELSIDS